MSFSIATAISQQSYCSLRGSVATLVSNPSEEPVDTVVIGSSLRWSPAAGQVWFTPLGAGQLDQLLQLIVGSETRYLFGFAYSPVLEMIVPIYAGGELWIKDVRVSGGALTLTQTVDQDDFTVTAVARDVISLSTANLHENDRPLGIPFNGAMNQKENESLLSKRLSSFYVFALPKTLYCAWETKNQFYVCSEPVSDDILDPNHDLRDNPTTSTSLYNLAPEMGITLPNLKDIAVLNDVMVQDSPYAVQGQYQPKTVVLSDFSHFTPIFHFTAANGRPRVCMGVPGAINFTLPGNVTREQTSQVILDPGTGGEDNNLYQVRHPDRHPKFVGTRDQLLVRVGTKQATDDD